MVQDSGPLSLISIPRVQTRADVRTATKGLIENNKIVQFLFVYVLGVQMKGLKRVSSDNVY